MKKIICFLLVFAMILALASCGASLTSGDLIGVWSGSWEYNGNRINTSIQFNRDGTYVETVYSNNQLVKTEQGSYTVDGNKVETEDSNTRGITEYTYSNGKLKNNGHSLTKE